MSSMQRWLDRTCCCPHPDPQECVRLLNAPADDQTLNRQRYTDILEDSCDCCCHYDEYESEDD